MKTIIKILGVGVVVAVVATALMVVVRAPERTDIAESVDCIDLTDKDVKSERSLGLIVKDGTLLAVRLRGENKFSPPGGHAELNETPLLALQRELNEELSVQSDTFQSYRITCATLDDGSTERTNYFVSTEINEQYELKDSGDEVKWVSYDFRTDEAADVELTEALNLLHEDGLVQ